VSSSSFPSHSISFKRKSKHQPRFSLSNLLPTSSPDTNPSRQLSPSPRYLRGRARDLREQGSRNGSNTSLAQLRTPTSGNWTETKEGAPLDWYAEGPGRRVGYEDLTTIDWIFEYTKERQRLRILFANTPGLIGYARRLLDASHVWLVLIITGVSVGVLAAAIDTVSLWLGDIKSGYCKNGAEGGRFYLHREFCCLGHDDLSQCQDWTTWREALHIPSREGAYTVEYIFFILYSVRTATHITIELC
jgi:chloride channel 3/4/5